MESTVDRYPLRFEVAVQEFPQDRMEEKPKARSASWVISGNGQRSEWLREIIRCSSEALNTTALIKPAIH